MSLRPLYLSLGLFLVTLATLMLEVLDTRLLSVMTWYHLSFLAVTVAMLGLAAGGVAVFLGGEAFSAERIGRSLPRAGLAFALALPLSHIANLATPLLTITTGTPAEFVSIGISTLLLAVPFVLGGIVVTLALTRSGAPIGPLYAVDLAGAASGCLVIVWLLQLTDITSTAFAASAAAALGAWCFARAAGRRGIGALALAIMSVGACWTNATATSPLGVFYPKNRARWLPDPGSAAYSAWNAHSFVQVGHPSPSQPFLWGPGAGVPERTVNLAWAVIDGEAGTTFTEWHGDPAALDWTSYDVTALPYRLRHGNVGVIGVGGGRDLLTAIGAGNPSVTGIEINKVMIDLLRGPYRGLTRIVDHPGVTLVNDEARSYLARTRPAFDVLQMSLIDTWAATGAGAFTLTENSLYTREGWGVFLRSLSPSGIFSVSRWYGGGEGAETTRLVSLGAAALLDAGAAAPRGHMILVTREHVGTLLVSRSPFTEADRRTVEQVSSDLGLTLRLTPWDEASENPRLGTIANATSDAELLRATADPTFDYRPPTDARPFFFNMLKPSAMFGGPGGFAVGVSGNLLATDTLLTLAAVSAVLVLAIVVWPLLAAGRPNLSGPVFGSALVYFSSIGAGFMFVQIAFLQRLSVYLGHPTYTFSIILFLMILAAGIGSFLSERLDLDGSRLPYRIPLLVAGLLLVQVAALPPALGATVSWQLAGRTLIAAIFIAPTAFALGFCFPIGMRLLGRHTDRVAAWMWGVNGACGVMASVVAVMASMWIGIASNLVAAAALYALLPIWMRRLAEHPAGERRRSAPPPA